MRLAPLLALAPLAALTAACGGSGGGNPVAKAATSSANAKAEHMHLSLSIDANSTPVTMQGDGDFANDPLLGSMNLTMHIGGRDVAMSEVASGSKVYMSSPLFQAQIPGGKKWMSIDYGKVLQGAGISLVGAASQSPAKGLKQLEATGDVKKMGEATVDGVHTTHYVAVLDPKKYAKLAGKLSSKLVYKPIDVWIDDQGHVRKEHVDSTSPKTATTPTTRSVMTVTFSNYGEGIHVTVPSASDTYDATALVAQQTSTNGGTP